MRVARLHGSGDLRLSDEPRPEVPAGHSLVRVTAVGLCGSDLHWYGQAGIGDARLLRPLVIGHELAGVVERGPLAGTRVAVDPAIPCGVCELCREGSPNLCPTIRFCGHGETDGALRQFLAWPSHLLHPLPDRLTDADGALLEPLGVAIHAVDLGHLRVAGSVAIIGCGPIGLLLLQVARVAGAATIIAVDPLPHRREAARRLGAEAVVAPGEATDEVWQVGGRYGVHVAFEAAGTDDAVGLAIAATRPGGRVVLAGIPDDDRTAFPASQARRKGLTMLLSRRMKEVYPRATSLAASGLVDVRSLVTATYPLSKVGEAFTAAAARTGLKVVVAP